jgi:hypothetical protein
MVPSKIPPLNSKYSIQRFSTTWAINTSAKVAGKFNKFLPLGKEF